MSVDLQKALGTIDKGAQECMEALRARKKTTGSRQDDHRNSPEVNWSH